MLFRSSHVGNAVVEKNVPDKRNCGKVMMFENGGTELSFLATPEIIKPKPINIMRPMADNSSIFNTVRKPCINVKLNT